MISSKEISRHGNSRVNLDEPWRAIREADRCLGCFDAPCIDGCPTRINIPEFIGRIRTENLEGAYETLVRTNPFPAICGLACPTEYLCEGRCIQTQLSGRPVEIAALQRFVCNQVHTKEVWPTTRSANTAIVGGGPAGLACAAGLRRLGYPVDLYDEHERLGGLLTYSIPAYRLPDDAVQTELSRLEGSGIRFFLNSLITAGRLRGLTTQYQAVFLSTGLSQGKPVEVDGIDLQGVMPALDFLAAVRGAQRGECLLPDLNGHVIVIGGGNVALDAACVAARNQAGKVTVIYRRSQKEMPAWESEYQDALRLGVDFRWLTDITRIEADGNRVRGVTVHRMKLHEKTDASGRRTVTPLPDSQETLPCDTVILAIGQSLRFTDLKDLGLETSREGVLQVDPATLETTRPGIFAGGDSIRGASYVVQAVADGMQAAHSIHRYLSGEEQQ